MSELKPHVTGRPPRTGPVPAIGQSMRVRDKGWALAYLRGRVQGYRQRNLTRRHVEGAIDIASRCGASVNEIHEELSRQLVDWDPVTRTIRVAD